MSLKGFQAQSLKRSSTITPGCTVRWDNPFAARHIMRARGLVIAAEKSRENLSAGAERVTVLWDCRMYDGGERCFKTIADHPRYMLQIVKGAPSVT